jgi:hypothetical protein
MSFRDSLATFTTGLDALIKAAGEVPPDLLAKLLHKSAVKTDPLAVALSISASNPVSVAAVKASAARVENEVAAIMVPVAPALAYGEPAPVEDSVGNAVATLTLLGAAPTA